MLIINMAYAKSKIHENMGVVLLKLLAYFLLPSVNLTIFILIMIILNKPSNLKNLESIGLI